MIGRALVTGGAGFIGSHLVRALLEQGAPTRVLDDFSTGHRHNLAGLQGDLEVCEGDLRDPSTCVAACREADTVFHLAALGSVPRSIQDPQTTNAVNVDGTLNLLVAARESGVRRFVFSSSSSVYGDTPTLPKHEEMRPSPRSPYAVSKLAAESYCLAFHRTYGLETVALRYFNVFGPRQDPESQYAAVIPKFLAAISLGRVPVFYGDGLQSRDFTFVTNVVQANLLAATVPEAVGRVFNIACGEQITLRQVLDQASSLMGTACSPQYLPERPGDIRHSLADISAARDRLGFRPTILFAEGIAETVRAFEEDPGRAPADPNSAALSVNETTN